MNALMTVQKRLSQQHSGSNLAALRAFKWLEKHDREIEPVSEDPAKVTVSEALRLWGTRQKTSKANLLGVTALLDQLRILAPQRKVEQFSFTGPRDTAVFLFTKKERSYLGSVIVERPRSK